MLFIKLLLIIFDALYYIIISPVYLPYKLYKYHRTLIWRKHPKVGDECYFNNMLGTKSFGKIKEIENNKVRFVQESLNSRSSQWIDISELYKS